MPSAKRWSAKFYGPDGTSFLKEFSSEKPVDPLPFLKNTPTFRQQLNGGYGECVLDLAYPYDDFPEGSTIDFMNVVDIWCYDRANPRGRRIYRGFVSRYEIYCNGGEDGVRVTLLGLVSLLTFSYYKDGAGYTVTHTSQDPETISRAIINHVNSIYTVSFLSYSGDTTDPVGATFTLDYEDQKWIDAITKTVELAGPGWWWKIDAIGQFWLKPKPVSATHTFTIGKDLESMVIPKSSEKVLNDVQVRHDVGSIDDDDAASQSAFGKRSLTVSATELDATGATQKAAKLIADDKDEKIQGTLVINSQYDVESVLVGQTCRIRNIRKGNAYFTDNMMIAAVNYAGDTITVELEEQDANFGMELQSLAA